MKASWWRITACCASVMDLLSLSLPVMYAYDAGSMESGEIMVRGFHLVEFSALDCIPLLVPLLLIAILYSRMTQNTKTLLYLSIATLDLVSLNHAAIRAHRWVESVCDSTITYGFCLPAYLIAITVVVVASCVVARYSKPE